MQLTSDSKEVKETLESRVKNYSMRDKMVNVNAKQSLWLQQKIKKGEKKG